MLKRKQIKSIHVAGSLWFGVCAIYLLVVALRRAGVGWWTIFSISGPSLVAAFVLISLYLYAVYRGATQDLTKAAEHPLTSLPAYLMFYYLSPFLGGLGAILGTLGTPEPGEYLSGTALGTVGATFFVWVILDPLLALTESLLPKSRVYRRGRLDRTRARRQHEQAVREDLLRQLEAEDQQVQAARQGLLEPMATLLADLLPRNCFEPARGQEQVIEVGIQAWRCGGIDAMMQLHAMVIERFEQENGCEPEVDVIANWWDGIGSWRTPAYLQEGRMGDV